MKDETSVVKVSVIVPVYNDNLSLKKCLEGLENQKFPAEQFEIIVVDDGSTDQVALTAKEDNVRYFYQENAGPAAARNKGVEMAKGDMVLFTDADCIPDENWIEEMVGSLKDPEIVGVKGAYKTKQTALWARFAQVEFMERYKLLLKSKYIDMVDTYSAGYKKEIFLSVGGFDTSYPDPNHEDTDLSYRMSTRGFKMVFNPNAYVCHASHPDTMKKYMRLKFWRGYWRMVTYERFSNKMLKDSYTPQTLKFQILFCFLFLPSLVLTLLFPKFMPGILVLCLLSFLIVSLPFLRVSIGQDMLVTLLSPFFLFFRALSLGSGVFYRLLKLLKAFFKKC